MESNFMEESESYRKEDVHEFNIKVVADMHLENELKKIKAEYEVLSTRKQVDNNFNDEESRLIDEELYLLFQKAVLIKLKQAYLNLNNTEKLLEYLELENNPFNQSRITKNQHGFITGLDLNECSFTEIPENIFYLTQLTKINISNNQINKIPDCIEVASGLESIKITNNRISGLPKGFEKLNKIKSLDLRDNDFEDLESIFDIISNLNQLTDLYVHQLQIDPLPQNISKTCFLKNLNIENDLVEESIETDPKKLNELKRQLPNTNIIFI